MGCFGSCGDGPSYAMPVSTGAGFNFALIVVLFVLLIIVLCAI